MKTGSLLGICVAGVLAMAVAAGAAGYARYGRFSGVPAEERAERLLELHAPSCDPAWIRASEGLLEVRCRDGRSVSFGLQPPCEDTLACDALGVDAACWERL